MSERGVGVGGWGGTQDVFQKGFFCRVAVIGRCQLVFLCVLALLSAASGH